jgi:2-keto-4-pentenoate hydratase/2-oxohepta-3-ene-1,7-dioic acid hydratase in catechol pathway
MSGFRLGTVDGRAVLVDDQDGWHDLATLAGDEGMVDPTVALADPSSLAALADRLDPAAAHGPLDDVTLGPPVPRPRQVFGIGLNYRSHAEETGAQIPPTPLVFTKFPGCLCGPTDDVELVTETVDYEVELVVVIGPGGRGIPREAAWDHVAGVTIGQDLSDRALQFASAPPHFDLGKSRPGYGPIGPLVVSTDRVADPDDLALSCSVNGEVRQDDRTSGLIVDVPELVAYLSSILELFPGDLIFTGTPAGVGMTDGRFLAPGDVLESTIEGLGTLRNHCV